MIERAVTYKAKGIRVESWNNPRLKIFELTTSPELAIFTGTSNIPLARKVARIIQEDFGIAAGRFDDGEVCTQLPASVNNKDVYLIQSTNPPAENKIELELMLEACRTSDARRITAIIPYFGYSRQDRKDAPRTPISARAMAEIYTVLGANRLVSVDIHAEQELGFTKVPWNNLYASLKVVKVLPSLNLNNPCFVSVDIGGIRRTRAYATRAGYDENIDTATVAKQKFESSINAYYIEGDVDNRDVVIVDDIINSARSLTSAAELVKNNGARNIYALMTHGMMFNRNHKVDTKALNRIEESPIIALYLTDTIKQPYEVIKHPKIKVITIADILAEAIIRLHVGRSLSPDLVD